MKDKELKIEETGSSLTLDGTWEGGVQGKGKGIGCRCSCVIRLVHLHTSISPS